ncbi:MAG: HD domain-containing phosphohydrolase [Limisphaerales bacterium]
MANPATSVDETEWRRLLVVDDEEIVLVALRETLMRAGYEVTATHDANEALDALRTTRYAVIITDQQMPKMTGLEFLAQAKELRPEATRILVTAVLNLGTVIEAINQGEIYRFIVKPWLREEFLGAIASAVERYRMVSAHTLLRDRAEQATRERGEIAARLDAVDRELESKERQLAETRRRALEERDRTREMAGALLSWHDEALGDRTRRVVSVCRAMAEAAGLSEPERDALEDAAWYHDLGCLRLDRALAGILPETRGKLEPSLRTEWERHAWKAGELLAALGCGGEVRAAVEMHHERLDGSGLPGGLAGESIPWLARLLGVAVAYVEASGSPDSALERVGRQSGTGFDSKAVRCLELGLRRKSAVPASP